MRLPPKENIKHFASRSWIPLVGLAVLALGVLGGPAVDHYDPNLAERLPITANVAAGGILAPLELYVAVVMITWIQSVRQRKAWQYARAGLVMEIDLQWGFVREILRYQFSVYDQSGPRSLINEAANVWVEILHKRGIPSGEQFDLLPILLENPDDAVWYVDAVADMWNNILCDERGLKQFHHYCRQLSRLLDDARSTAGPNTYTLIRTLTSALDDVRFILSALASEESRFDPPFKPDKGPFAVALGPKGTARAAWPAVIVKHQALDKKESLNDLLSLFRLARNVVRQGDSIIGEIRRENGMKELSHWQPEEEDLESIYDKVMRNNPGPPSRRTGGPPEPSAL